MGSFQVFDPTAEVKKEDIVFAPRPESLRNLRIGLVDNTKYNSDKLLLKIAAILESLDITQPQYTAWLGCPVQGHRLTCFFKMNPNLHIRNLYDLLVEHQEIIRAY